MQGLDHPAVVHRWQERIDQHLTVFGIAQLRHEIMKGRILFVWDPRTGQKTLKHRLHGAGRKQGDFLGVNAQVFASGTARKHIPMGFGQ